MWRVWCVQNGSDSWVGVGVWVVFWTMKIIINYQARPSSVFFCLYKKSVSSGVLFNHILPTSTLSTVLVLFGPRTAPNGPKRDPVSSGRAPPGFGCRILGRNPLGQCAGCLLVMFCLVFSRKWCDLAPKQPQKGPKMAPKWV